MPRSLKRIALVVTSGTLLSKVGGLVRQLVIAGAFGVGAAYDAYNYAYILPGFLLILLGGINGPFHTSVVSVLSRRPKEESAYVISVLNTIIGTVLFFATGLLVVAADPLINIVAPGLTADIHRIAVLQLRIMAPLALLAGLIGIGFGSLNATDEFWIPAISPIMSNVALIIGVGFFWFSVGPEIKSIEFALKGGFILALSTLIGAILQWLIQIPALIKKELIKFKLVWDFNHPGVQEIWKIIAPASLSSGMLQINVCTDLFFASGILGAAAGLSYASLLVQAPLGLISNGLLIPLLPTFAKLTDPSDKPELIARIRQSLMISTASMIVLGALFVGLSEPLVSLFYQRGAFDNNAVELVAGILIAYGLGMPAYLGRDILVRVFYALGDGKTPLRISIAGIGLNILFDWFLVGGPSPWGQQLPFNFGAPGLVLATTGINIISCAALLVNLNLRLKGLPLKHWTLDTLKLLFAGISSGLIAWILNKGVIWPTDVLGLFWEVIFSASISVCLFFLISNSLEVKEVNEILNLLRKKFIFR